MSAYFEALEAHNEAHTGARPDMTDEQKARIKRMMEARGHA